MTWKIFIIYRILFVPQRIKVERIHLRRVHADSHLLVVDDNQDDLKYYFVLNKGRQI